MGRKHYIVPTVPLTPPLTVRLGAGSAEGDRLSDLEVGKFYKLGGESRFIASVAGDDIDGVITSVESATSDGFSVGGVFRGRSGDTLWVTFDGLQATPGVGAIAIGDTVNVGTVVAKGTGLSGAYPKVTKATTAANVIQKWRVVSLGTVGTGAVGTVGVIERV